MRSVFETNLGLRGLGAHIAVKAVPSSTYYAANRVYRPGGSRAGSGGTCEGCMGLPVIAAADLNSMSKRMTFRPNSIMDSNMCGQPGGMPCPTGDSRASLAGLGSLGRIRNFLCSDHTDVLDQIDNLIGEADRIGVAPLTYTQAKTYVAKFDRWGTTANPILPSTCDKEIALGRQIYNALAMTLKASGGAEGQPLFTPDQLTAPPQQDITGTIKTVAIVTGIIAGAVVLFPIVKEIIFARRAMRGSK